jgi:hypothetical protein
MAGVRFLLAAAAEGAQWGLFSLIPLGIVAIGGIRFIRLIVSQWRATAEDRAAVVAAVEGVVDEPVTDGPERSSHAGKLSYASRPTSRKKDLTRMAFS